MTRTISHYRILERIDEHAVSATSLREPFSPHRHGQLSVTRTADIPRDADWTDRFSDGTRIALMTRMTNTAAAEESWRDR